jgi:hypothetical protein
MANRWGGRTDHFGVLAIVDGATTLATKLKLLSAPYEPDANTASDAPNFAGDIVDWVAHGNTAGKLIEASTEFLVIGSFNINLIKLGEIVGVSPAPNKVITGVSVSTQNGGGGTKLTVTGKVGTQAIVKPTGFVNTYTLPSITIGEGFVAQELGFTIDKGRLLSSSLNASISLAQENDGLGEPAAHGLSGGELIVEATIGALADACAWTVDLSGAVEMKAPGASEAQADWEQTTASYRYVIARDVT